ncbi:MAG: glycogen debranching protein GlgX [Caldilineaceae bacterium]
MTVSLAAIHNIGPGRSAPLGATIQPGGVNFSFFSQNATYAELLLFRQPNDPAPARILRFDPVLNRTFYYWHMFVPGIGHGQAYALRVFGPMEPEAGHRFDGSKVLVDPYARAVYTGLWQRSNASKPGDNVATSMRSLVVDPSHYDWEDDAPPHRPGDRAIIYEMHVGGFTRDPSSGLPETTRGTYRGVIEKIPYLQALGITHVELMPVAQFDLQDAPDGVTNYWGYSPVCFMAPHSEYATGRDPLRAVDEFRDMVKALHRAGIGVLLDVVFNHTAEAGNDGPTLGLRGLENVAYYIPGDTPDSYANFSGCGNSINANHSIVRRLVMDSLRYWVTEMHVDGFRFDLASALSRGEFGEPLASPPLLWEIESDPVLAGTPIIAEAWDAGGLYQVGSFIGDRFAEWNGRFRDEVRSFVKGDPGHALNLSMRLAGSPDLYPRADRNVRRTLNFITAHDGFTLNDLVSYSNKHNEANGEQSRDGHGDNRSWNCGAEGPTSNPAIERLRERQIRNFLTLLFCAQGTPMLLMGDEVRRTQRGNTNAYGQDNPISWFNWHDVERHAGVLRFVRELIRLHAELSLFHLTSYMHVGHHKGEPWAIFQGTDVGKFEFEPEARWLSWTLGHPTAGDQVHAMANAFWEPLEFELPALKRGQQWRQLIDTSLHSPHDIMRSEQAPPVTDQNMVLPPRTIVLLRAWPPKPRSPG